MPQLVILALIGCWAFWFRWRINRGMRRLLVAVRSRDSMPHMSHWADQGLADELEFEIHKLKRELNRKSESLARESRDVDAMMAAISDAVVAVDRQGKVLFYNSQFALWFGKGNPDAGALHGLGDWIRDPGALEAFAALSPESVSFAIVSQTDGIARDIMLSVRQLSRESVLGVFHDVTSLKRAERMRIDFVANVSHEIKTPLTAIKGYTETIREDLEARDLGLFDQLRDSALRVERNVDRLMALVQDLLDLSALEQADDAARIQKAWLNTKHVTEQVLERLYQRDRELEGRISVDFGATEVFADPLRLEQVVTNLIDNALKHTPERTPIGIRWNEAGDGVQPATRLTIWDEGPGISLEHQQRLFERFYRVDKARSRSLGGTGLGLAIVKHIMANHGGSVRLESEPGSGAAFVCTFPGA